MDRHPQLYCQYKSGVEKLMQRKEQNLPRKPMKVTWVYGPTGTGKTYWCVEQAKLLYGDDYWTTAPGDLKWFDGYCGQRCVIIDDFRKGDCKFAFLLRLFDQYRLSVQVKGGFVMFTPEHIYVTCPYEPRSYFSYQDTNGITHDREDIGQLMRRLTEVIHRPFATHQAQVVTQDEAA